MRKAMALACLLALLAAGCTTYYKVHDPTSGKTYYSTDIKNKGDGAVSLKDARTGATVTVQNSEVHKVTKEEWESGKNMAPSTQPAM